MPSRPAPSYRALCIVLATGQVPPRPDRSFDPISFSWVVPSGAEWLVARIRVVFAMVVGAAVQAVILRPCFTLDVEFEETAPSAASINRAEA